MRDQKRWMKNWIRALAVGTMITAAVPISVMAAEKGWVNEDGAAHYVDSNGSYVKNQWKTSQGVSYYLDENGNKVDHGRDYTALANYLHSHWRKEFGGHRYKATRNCIRPEPEPATEAVREYSPKHPPVAPRGYILVEARMTKYGYQYYKYVVDPRSEHKRNEAAFLKPRK